MLPAPASSLVALEGGSKPKGGLYLLNEERAHTVESTLFTQL